MFQCLYYGHASITATNGVIEALYCIMKSLTHMCLCVRRHTAQHNIVQYEWIAIQGGGGGGGGDLFYELLSINGTLLFFKKN